MIGLGRRGSYVRLLAAILLALLVHPMLTHWFGPSRWVAVGFSMLVLLAALDATQAARRTRRLVWGLGLLAIFAAWAAFAAGGSGTGSETLQRTWSGVRHLCSVAFLGVVIWLLIVRALAPGRVTPDRIVAAICAYMLLGLLWASGYQLLASVLGPGLSTGAASSPQDYVYFSFVTLTTLGYGDILPVHDAFRALAYLEAVTGVLYLATLVARLVALHIAHEGVPAPDHSPDEAEGTDAS